ncbi:MAG: fibrinogen-like YCDxxxxGGGW domain-containing protein [Deltaproteobacteria bacterium]|jgi:hypothetical protein|nr:fibrinogen-like YCDxxxxGGGW domain-containing protein [Deltaproteobacteria bacterium]
MQNKYLLLFLFFLTASCSFDKSGLEIELIDECAEGTHDCDPNALCTDRETGYECTCKEGYIGDGKTCADINECEEELVHCPENSHCLNTQGGYQCECDDGYYEYEGLCVDIDECAAEIDECDEVAQCINTSGGYLCECPPGYTNEDNNCIDINECEDGNACGYGFQCINTSGSYDCQCFSGFNFIDGECFPNSCRSIILAYPGTTDGTKIIDTGSGGQIPVYCDMTTDGKVGYTMFKVVDSNLAGDQDDYREVCASYGMEVIVPRTRAHAQSIYNWNGFYPNLVNIFPINDGATGLENFQGICQGNPCSFYLADTRNSCVPSQFEPNGNNSTAYSLFLWYVSEDSSWGCHDDSNNRVEGQYQGWVICSANDTPEPSSLNDCLQYVNRDRVWNKGVHGISGEYTIRIDGNPVSAWCDQNTDGGGWTLVLNYLHQGETNPQLNPRNIQLPIRGADELGEDESGTIYWGHVSNQLFAKLPVTEVRFYSRTNQNNSIIDFSTADAGCIDYFSTGTGSCSTQLKVNYHAFKEHYGYLPRDIDAYGVDQGDEALAASPFSHDQTRGWSMQAEGNRWQSDSVAEDQYHTLHRVYVRNKPRRRSCLEILNSGNSMGSGFYPVDPDGPGGEQPFITWCDQETAGGGWTLVALYGKSGGRPDNFSGDYPRPGASFYNTSTLGTTIEMHRFFNFDNNSTGFTSFSVDASRLWHESDQEILAWVGGATDNYIYADLPAGCNYFDGSTWCLEDTYGPFTIFTADGSALTTNAYACTTAHNYPPYEGDIYNEFGLHLLDGLDNSEPYNCHLTTSTLGVSSIGRIFTSFESSNGSYWNSGVTQHWNNSGELFVPGALFIR